MSYSSDWMKENSLKVDDALLAGQHVHSSNGTVELVLQMDGNLVLYRTKDQFPLWASETCGHFTTGINATLLENGNFVLRAESNHVWWQSGTSGLTNARAVVSDNGNLEVFGEDSSEPAWSSNSQAKMSA